MMERVPKRMSAGAVLVLVLACALLIGNMNGGEFAANAPFLLAPGTFGWPFPFVLRDAAYYRVHYRLWYLPIDVGVATIYLAAAYYVGKLPPLLGRSMRIDWLALIAVVLMADLLVFERVAPALVAITLVGGSVIVFAASAHLVTRHYGRQVEQSNNECKTLE